MSRFKWIVAPFLMLSVVSFTARTMAAPQNQAANELVFPIVVNGSPAGASHYQTIFTVLNTSTQSLQATLQVYSNSGKPDGAFCSPVAPPPSRLTAALDPNSQLFQFTSADLAFLNGWASLDWVGPPSILASEEVTLIAATPPPCLLVCNLPSTVKLSSTQLAAVKPAREFRIPVTINPNRQTALALVNPSAMAAVTVRLSILDASGAAANLGVASSFEVSIPPLARISKFLWEIALEHSSPAAAPIPPPESFQGSLVLSGDNPFAVGALHIMFPEAKFVSVPTFSP